MKLQRVSKQEAERMDKVKDGPRKQLISSSECKTLNRPGEHKSRWEVH